jgi:hypothetical protein
MTDVAGSVGSPLLGSPPTLTKRCAESRWFIRRPRFGNLLCESMRIGSFDVRQCALLAAQLPRGAEEIEER